MNTSQLEEFFSRMYFVLKTNGGIKIKTKFAKYAKHTKLIWLILVTGFDFKQSYVIRILPCLNILI